MSALDFLTPTAASEEIVARTPMERLARRAGGRFERRHGWRVAVEFAGASTERELITNSVGFADRSSMTKLELNAAADALAQRGLRPGIAVRRDAAWWCPVTQTRVLVVGEADDAAALLAAVGELGGSVVDMSCALAALALIGPQCRELLARFCAIDVRPAVAPVASLRPGSVARTPGYVLVEDDQQLLIMVGWALGEYLYEVVADAAERLGGGPVGEDSLRERVRA